MNITTIQKEPDYDITESKETNAELFGRTVDLSTVMVQVLKRQTDPLTPGLEAALHAWVCAGMAYQPTLDSFGGWIDVARNWQTTLFRKASKFEWLLMVDADVTPPVNAPILLLRHNKPVVSACVAGYNQERGVFLCVAVKGRDGKARFPTLNKTKTIPARGLVEVHNAGTGCLLVRRDVIETLWARYEAEKEAESMAKSAIIDVLAGKELDGVGRTALFEHLKRFDYVNDVSGAPFNIAQSVRDRAAEIGAMPKGEDICFTDRVRAAGFTIYADFEVHCGHDKQMRLMWPKDGIDAELSVEDWITSAYDAPVVQE